MSRANTGLENFVAEVKFPCGVHMPLQERFKRASSQFRKRPAYSCHMYRDVINSLSFVQDVLVFRIARLEVKEFQNT